MTWRAARAKWLPLASRHGSSSNGYRLEIDYKRNISSVVNISPAAAPVRCKLFVLFRPFSLTFVWAVDWQLRRRDLIGIGRIFVPKWPLNWLLVIKSRESRNSNYHCVNLSTSRHARVSRELWNVVEFIMQQDGLISYQTSFCDFIFYLNIKFRFILSV